MIKKLFKIFLVISALCLLIPTVSVVMQLMTDEKPVIFHTPETVGKIVPGESVNYQITVESDWLTPPSEKVDVPTLEGAQLAYEPKRTLIGGSFTKAKWNIDFSLMAYDFPDKKEFELKIPFDSFIGKRQKSKELTLPLFELNPDFDNSGDIAVYDTMNELSAETEISMIVWVIIAIVVWLFLFLAITVFLLIKGASKGTVRKVVVPPWVTANQKLNYIKARLPMAAEQFFVELSDVLRLYIEKLYKLPATESTTKEFLDEIQRAEFLTKETKSVLSSFMIEADMIKFAKQDATEEQILKSLNTAESFVLTSSNEVLNKEKSNA